MTRLVVRSTKCFVLMEWLKEFLRGDFPQDRYTNIRLPDSEVVDSKFIDNLRVELIELWSEESSKRAEGVKESPAMQLARHRAIKDREVFISQTKEKSPAKKVVKSGAEKPKQKTWLGQGVDTDKQSGSSSPNKDSQIEGANTRSSNPYKNLAPEEESTDEEATKLQDEKDMAILVAYPEDSPKIPSNQKLGQWAEQVFGDNDGKANGAGHAGIVIINQPEGTTRYFDFGRYNRTDVAGTRSENQGAVRSSKNYSALRIPDWDEGQSEASNVDSILSRLHRSRLLARYGQIKGALAKNLDFCAMEAYAEEMESTGYHDFGGYGSGTAIGNATYCAKFARGVAKAGGHDFSMYSGFTGLHNVEDVSSQYGTDIITKD